uniref:C-type lectin domain-containing protein n=1 Tax=Acrobeloides nanus TaxID=290746 RepID=A0A914DLC5_9BILA
MLLQVWLLASWISIVVAYNALDTVLEKKCNFLRTRTRTGFVGNSCFACTKEAYNTSLKDWPTLHKKCVDINGYKGRMAFIRTEEQIEELVKLKVVKEHGRYYIGAKQDPPSDCGAQLCKRNKHILSWFYMDESGQKQGELNANLWLRNEPNNQGDTPPENVVTLEQLDQNKLGFNDANGQQQPFPILCEYPNILQCSDRYTLIGNKCYQVKFGADGVGATPKQAEEDCQKDGGRLPSIHSDKQNTLIADFARKFWDKREKDGLIPKDSADPWLQHGPVLFGLKFDDEWKNFDKSLADYFRWFYLEGKGHPNVAFPPAEYKHTVFFAATNGNNGVATFAYWANVYKDGQDVPSYICEVDPTIE